jgi:hypothetical protein
VVERCGRVTARSDSATRIDAAIETVLEAIGKIDASIRRYALVELNLDERIKADDLGTRQEKMAVGMHISVKTVRRRGNDAMTALSYHIVARPSAPAMSQTGSGRSFEIDERHGEPPPKSERLGQTRLLHFHDGADVRIVCDEFPPNDIPPHGLPENFNYSFLARIPDIDALLELYSYVRAANIGSQVSVELLRSMSASLTSHLILLGVDALVSTGTIITNSLDLPVRVRVDEARPEGSFEVEDSAGSKHVIGATISSDSRRLIEDVGLLLRTPNPFARDKTLMICGGLFTRGTYGVVRCLTDGQLAERNAAYIQARFNDDSTFMVLMRVRVGGTAIATPDLADETIRCSKRGGKIETDANLIKQPTRAFDLVIRAAPMWSGPSPTMTP